MVNENQRSSAYSEQESKHIVPANGESMRILIVANSDLGLYRFRKELVQSLCRNHDVVFCVPYGEYVNDIIGLGAEFEPCEALSRHGTNPLQEVKLLSYYSQLISRTHPDFVLSFTIKPNIYSGLVCSRKGIPYLPTVTGLGTAIENEGLLQKMLLRLYAIALRDAQTVFFQNESNLRFLQEQNVVSSKCKVIPGSGVNLQQFKPMPYPKDEIVNFVFMARVMEEKGIEQFLDAAVAIRKENKKAVFHVCGEIEDGYRGKLLQRVANNDVLYHGLVRDTTKIYEMASCIVHPTYYPEGLSNVLLESCACARPIITTNRPGCAEVLVDGLNGYAVNEQDSRDLIHHIKAFLSLTVEERRAMGLNGRKKVEKEFDRRIVVEQYLTEIETLAN